MDSLKSVHTLGNFAGQHITELVNGHIKGHISLFVELVVFFNFLFVLNVDIKAQLFFLFINVRLVMRRLQENNLYKNL